MIARAAKPLRRPRRSCHDWPGPWLPGTTPSYESGPGLFGDPFRAEDAATRRLTDGASRRVTWPEVVTAAAATAGREGFGSLRLWFGFFSQPRQQIYIRKYQSEMVGGTEIEPVTSSVSGQSAGRCLVLEGAGCRRDLRLDLRDVAVRA